MSLELEKHLVARANETRTPITANFELTPVCNMKCDMCFIRLPQAQVQALGGLRPLESWLDIARQLRQMGTLFILLTGGEPMLYPQFNELYMELRRMGFIITINTNGTLITEETCRMFARLQPRRVNVTLYGASRETYADMCHHADGFDRCMSALRLLKQYHIDTKINVSVTRRSVADYEAIMAIADELGMPAVVNAYMFPALRQLCAGCRDVDAERITPEQAARYQEAFMRYRQGADYPQYLRSIVYNVDEVEPDSEGQGVSCRAARSSVWINWRQQMTPCVLMEHPMVPLDGTTVADAWASVTAQADQLPRFEKCAGCRLRKLCQVCYAAAEHEQKARGNLDYLCEMAHRQLNLIRSTLLPTEISSDAKSKYGVNTE